MPLPCRHRTLAKPSPPEPEVPRPADATPPIDPPVADPLPVVAKPRRGRPRKHASGAEKQEAYRERKAQNEQEEKRRNLIARIIQRHRGMLSDPFNQRGESTTIVERVRISNKNYIRKLRADLDVMTLEKVETYAEKLFANADRKGRLPGESSGGEEPGAGSRAENVQAANYGANKPKGAAPDSFEKCDYWTPYSTQFPKKIPVSVTLPEDEAEREELKDAAIDVLAPGGRCSICDLLDICHLRWLYQEGERQKEYVRNLKKLHEESPMPSFDLVLIAEQKKITDNTHYTAILVRMRRLYNADAPKPGQETKMGRKLKRLGRKAAGADKEEERQKNEEQAARENWGTTQKTKSWGATTGLTKDPSR